MKERDIYCVEKENQITKYTEITGDQKLIFSRFQRVIWKIGLRSKKVRYLYWKYSGHTYLWGIRHYLADHYMADPNPCTVDDLKVHPWIDDHLDDIFKEKDH